MEQFTTHVLALLSGVIIGSTYTALYMRVQQLRTLNGELRHEADRAHELAETHDVEVVEL